MRGRVNEEQNQHIQEIILDKRTKMFYVCSRLSPTPGAWLASRPVTGSQVWLSVRVLTDDCGPGCGCVLAQGSGYYGPDARKRL